MTEFLTQEWFDALIVLAAQLPPLPNVSCRLQWEVARTPTDVMTTHAVMDKGAPLDLGFGAIENPDLVLSLSYQDAAFVHQGELMPSVAFMQGRLKVSGNQKLWFQLLPITHTEAFSVGHAAIREMTNFGA